MKREIDIHDYPRRLGYALKYLENSKMSQRNKQLVLEFRDYCSLNNIGIARIVRYLGVLKVIAELLVVDFDKAKTEDIMRVVRIIQENENLTAWSKSTYKIMLKRFYKWLKNTGDSYPEEVKWVKSRIKLSERKLPANGELLTEDEVKRLISAAEHPRDKAIIAVLYESGARIGEIGSLQIKNVNFDEYGAVINVEGKTGARPIRVLLSTPYLVTWLESHPFKDNKEAPLWINYGTSKHHQSMKYQAFRNMLSRLFEKAGIKKRYNPHMFRHSRATFLADHLTEFQMNQYFGWIQGSQMPATYVHMSGSNTDASILKLNGINVPESHKANGLRPIICPRCDTINAYDARFCNKCAGILDAKTAFELEEKKIREKETRTKADDVMNLLMKDPEFVSIFLGKIKEMGLAGKMVLH